MSFGVLEIIAIVAPIIITIIGTAWILSWKLSESMTKIGTTLENFIKSHGREHDIFYAVGSPPKKEEDK